MTELDRINLNTLNEIAKIISSKKYGLSYQSVKTDNLVILSDKIFKEKSHLLFSSTNTEESRDLDNILGGYLSDISTQYFSKRKIDDEVKLIQRAYDVDNFLNSHNLTLLDDDEGDRLRLKNHKKARSDFFKQLEMTDDLALKNAITAKHMNRVDNNSVQGLSLFFASNRLTHHGREKISLSIISQKPEKIGLFRLSNTYLFNYDKFNDMESRPIRLFLKILDYYGEDITIDGITKRFWDFEYLPQVGINFNQDAIHIKRRNPKSKRNHLVSMFGKKSAFSDQVAFLYSIDYEAYFLDLRDDAI